MSDLFMEAWEPGVPVVLVHGSLATGSDEWQAQRPLADSDFRLFRTGVVMDEVPRLKAPNTQADTKKPRTMPGLFCR